MDFPKRTMRAAVLLSLTSATLLNAAVIDSTWDLGANGTWDTASNWDPQTIPSNGADTFNVSISDGSSNVELSTTLAIDSLTVANGNTLTITQNYDLTINAPITTNNGAINLNSTGGAVELIFTDESPFLLGSGVLTMNNYTSNWIHAQGGVITHGADHTIQGTGVLLRNASGMENKGTLLANDSSPFIINPDSSGFINSGTMLATGAGGFSFGDGVYTNTGHSIDIESGSRLMLNQFTEIIGGTINTTGTGYVSFFDDDVVLQDISLNGTMNLINSINTEIQNGITNNGTINLLGTGIDTSLEFTGISPTLSGTGEIVMSNNALNRIYHSGGILTQGADHIIRGAGNLLSDVGGMINHGTIIADQSVALTIDPDANGFDNRGVVNATGAGGIIFADGDITNSVGGIFTGIGTIDVSAANFVNAGTLSPGASPGTLTIQGDIAFDPTANIYIEIAGTSAGSEYDVLNVTGSGSVALDGDLDILLLGFTPNIADEFTILTSTGNITGSFDNVSDGVVQFAGGQFDVAYTPNSVVLSNFSAVPEPHEWALFTSLAAMGYAIRRRRR